MNQPNTHFLKIVFFFVVLSTSAVADVIVPPPPGYTIQQPRRINAIAIDTNDNKWFAFGIIGLGKLDASNVWTMYDSLNSPLPNNRIFSVCCNASGVWAGTNSGLYNFNGATWTSYKMSNSNIPSDSVPNLYSAGGNTLMIFSDKGLVYFNGTSFTSYNTGNSALVNDTVQCAFQSSAGMWWIGTSHGLSFFDGTIWQSYTKANAFNCDDNILSINEDINNNLFVGTKRAGLLIKSGANFNSLNSSIDDHFALPQAMAKIMRLSDGRIFASSQYLEYLISTNPIDVRVKKKSYGLYNSSTPGYIGAIDSSDKIWWFYSFANSVIRITDSIHLNPDTTVVENYKYNYLDINEVKCGMENDNKFFEKSFTANSPGFEAPKYECGVNGMYSSSLWIGGLDAGGNLHLSVSSNKQGGDFFWPGPLDTIGGVIDSTTMIRYDSIWKVNRYIVDEFITQYQLGNVTSGSYIIPNIILNWPAHGSGSYSRDLAPFVDMNADGIYNPYHGDYPDVKGDQMLWWVMNDNLNNWRSPFNLGVEIRSKAYAYSCQNVSTADESVNYTTFYSDSIINRSNTDYHDVYIGIYVDANVGTDFDDRVGCRIDGDYGFFYNGDNYDEDSTGYGENPPMISVALLKGPRAEPNDGLDNNHNGIIDEQGENCMMNHFVFYDNLFGINGHPQTELQCYNYMKSIWKNNAHVTYGGDGYGGGCGSTNIPTDYMYSGMPYDTGWTDAGGCTPPDDRKFLISSGPFTLRAHESKTLDYVIVFSWDKTQPNGLNTSIAKNHADVMNVKHWFETDSFPCKNSSIGIREIEKNNNGLFLYPNPAQGQYSLVFKGASKGEMELLDITGRVVKQQIVFPNQKNIIDVHDVAKGMYVVRVKDSQGTTSGKIIIE